ncbi:MAG: zinc-ribbon domain-containing protein [Desulfohalobium sp.]
MEIQCPKCEFVRNVPEDKIPARARLATCPKCGHKFPFRDVEPQDPHTGEAEETARTEEPQHAPPAFGENDATPRAEEPPQEPLSSAQPEDPPTEDTEPPRQDIWASLEALQAEPEPDEAPPHSRSSVPWENLEEHGFFTGLRLTITQAMLGPRRFFTQMPINFGLSMPLVFYLLIAEVQALAQFFWQMVGLSPQMGQNTQIGLVGLGSALILIVYPLFLAGVLFFVSGINHVCLLALRSGKAGFQGTFRAVAYGSAPFVLAVIPVIGPMMGGIWAMVCTIIGLSCVHETSLGRVLLALFLPFIVLAAISVVLVMLQAAI